MQILIAKTGELRFNKNLFGLARETFWVGAGQALSALGAVVGVRLLTQALSPEMYGKLALSMTVVGLTHQLFIGPLSGSILRLYSASKQSDRFVEFFHGSLRLIKQVSLIQIAVAAAIGAFLAFSGYAKYLPLTAAGLLFAVASGYNAILDSFQNAARRRIITAFHQAVGQWLRFLMAAGFCIAATESSAAAMSGYAAASLLILISQLIFFRRELPKVSIREGYNSNDILDWHLQIRKYAQPFAAWSIFTWAFSASDRWAIQFYGAASAVGLYAALYQLGYYPINLFYGLIVQVAEPIIYGRAGDGSDRKKIAAARRLINMLLLGGLILTCFASLIAYLFHKQIFSLLVGKQYQGVSSLLPLVVLSGGIFASSQAASLQSLAELKPQRLLPPKIVMSLLGIVLNMFGAYYKGIEGVAFASLAFALINLIWIICLNAFFKKNGDKAAL